VSDRRVVKLQIGPDGVVEGRMHVHREQLESRPSGLCSACLAVLKATVLHGLVQSTSALQSRDC
jgi:hypothetical protein